MIRTSRQLWASRWTCRAETDLVVVGMLLFGQLFRKITHMVVVDQRDRPDRLLLLGAEPFLHQRSPDQVPDRLGAVHVALLFDQLIEICQQLLVERYTESDRISHRIHLCFALNGLLYKRFYVELEPLYYTGR